MEHVANTHPVLNRKQRHCPGNRIITTIIIGLPLIHPSSPRKSDEGSKHCAVILIHLHIFLFHDFFHFSTLNFSIANSGFLAAGALLHLSLAFSRLLIWAIYFRPLRRPAQWKSPYTPLQTDFHFVSSSPSRRLDVPLRTFLGFRIGVADEVYFMVSLPPTYIQPAINSRA